MVSRLPQACLEVWRDAIIQTCVSDTQPAELCDVTLSLLDIYTVFLSFLFFLLHNTPEK
jgi:hypothetical protein